MLVLGILSLVLVNVDYLTSWLDQPRSVLSLLFSPVVHAAHLPQQSFHSLTAFFSAQEELHAQLQSLENTIDALQIKSGQMEMLLAENKRLRILLDATTRVEYELRPAESIGVNPDPERQEVIINQGTAEGVFVGQVILNASGVLGQVIAVDRYSSRVLLISDQAHSIPVQILRNNIRLIAQGTGIEQRLALHDVKNTTDIHVGDLLVSSGLGGRFPAGYSVGVVEEVVFEPRDHFLRVMVKPTAQLKHSRWVLLVINEAERAKVSVGSAPESDSHE